ncbi:MAG: ATP-binding protein [Dehalococcoidia bacterium]|nr:ATP-binding protein [Dehalococcoidia bacterium]
MEPLRLRFLGALVEELGRRMYPSLTATIAELISNAWDADAENVWVEIPFGQPWTTASRIVVTDDGNGMTRQEAASRYLIVGVKRRIDGKDLSDRKKRKVHGRKGIGKLAAFGTADVLRLTTKSAQTGEITAFALDYEEIRKTQPGADVSVSETDAPPPLTPPDGAQLEHGTRIELSRLNLTQPLSEERFIQSMSRRFALAATEMAVLVNGKPLERFEVPTRFRFPPDALPDGAATEGDLALETIDGKQVRWWLGFTPRPIEEEELRGVAVIARGKMAQRPFMFHRGRGVAGQLGQEYLVGEVFADWIDDDPDITGDLISTNRAELMFEDQRLAKFLDWGKERVNWALRKREEFIEHENIQKLDLSADIQRHLSDFTQPEQRAFRAIGARLAKIPEIAPEHVEGLMGDLLAGHSDKAVREMIDAINAAQPDQQDLIWPLVAEFGLIDARRLKSIIEARLAVIAKLRALVQGGAREVPEIHQHIKANYWLIDPRWQLMDDEVGLTKLLESHFKLNRPSARGERLDFVYCLAPATSAPRDVVFLVEIKRGTVESRAPRKVTSSEIHRFHDYYVHLDEQLKKVDTYPPSLRAIMIAADYEHEALGVKASLEQIGLQFRSWDSVLAETERLHSGWLQLSKTRIQTAGPPVNG